MENTRASDPRAGLFPNYLDKLPTRLENVERQRDMPFISKSEQR